MTKPETQTTGVITTPTEEVQKFELAQRKAKLLASSDIVPKAYRGNVANCLVAMRMAETTGADPIMVMTQLYDVHGKPNFSAQFLIACFNTKGLYSPIRYRFIGEEGKDSWGCVAYAYELLTGEILEGPAVTIAMAKGEGWAGKTGSKWKHMPELMLRYRAATFLVRTTAPEITMGMLTDDEVSDIELPRPVVATSTSLNEVMNAIAETEPVTEPVTEHDAPYPETGKDAPPASGPSELFDTSAGYQ